MKKNLSKGFGSESSKKDFQINFPNGQASFVDEKTMQYILYLQNIIKNQKSIPKFYDLNSFTKIEAGIKKTIDFYNDLTTC